jgi:hypothetical protein
VLYLALDRPQQAARSGRRIVSEEQCRLYQRKAQSENKKPKTISDVDRSRFLTAACGSVVMLWGQAIVQDSLDVVAIVWGATPETPTAKAVAKAMFGKSEPKPDELRRLANSKRRSRKSTLERVEGAGEKGAVGYRPATSCSISRDDLTVHPTDAPYVAGGLRRTLRSAHAPHATTTATGSGTTARWSTPSPTPSTATRCASRRPACSLRSWRQVFPPNKTSEWLT